MNLSNFLCVGAPKCGTTTLHYILQQHPDIFLPPIKETNFFLLDDLYEKGREFYQKEFFSGWKGEKIIGEINPSYFFDKKIVIRIFETLGSNIKLIFMFRNPVDRAYSNYWMMVRKGFEKKSFLDAISLEDKRCDLNQIQKNKFCYLTKGLYSRYLENFLRIFPIENMFFIIFESDFLKIRKVTIESLLKFLNVDFSIKLDLNIKKNYASLPRLRWISKLIYADNYLKNLFKKIVKNKENRKTMLTLLERLNNKPFSPPELDRQFKKELVEKYFLNDILKLEKIIERDLSIWYI